MRDRLPPNFCVTNNFRPHMYGAILLANVCGSANIGVNDYYLPLSSWAEFLCSSPQLGAVR